MPKSKKARVGERFKCPYEGCKRSFAELWRLKVHYRAPPDVRGSGKERGHGQELAQCPLCGAHLMPGKHHIQCTGSRKVQEGADDSKGTTKAAASVPKHAPPASNAKPEALRAHPQTVGPSGPAKHGPYYGADAWQGMHVQRSHSYGHVHTQPGVQWPPAQPLAQPASTSGTANGSGESYWNPAGHSQGLQAASSTLYRSGGSYAQLPSMHHVPVQYTNTLTREAVPGKPCASHVSLQTDLCGQTWPLSQPFPYPTSSFFTTHPFHGQAHFAAVHPPGGHPYATSSPYVHSATMSSHHVDFQPRPGSPTYALPEVVASASEPVSNTELHPHAASATPVSPPSSPPPGMLVDDLFDFDRLEATTDFAMPTRSDDLQDIDAVLGMHALPAANDDLFKMLTHDPVAGNPVLTTHIHQRDASDVGFDFAGPRPCSGEIAQHNVMHDAAHMPQHGSAAGAADEFAAMRHAQMMHSESMAARRFAGNCGQVAAMIKPDASDSGAAVRL